MLLSWPAIFFYAFIAVNLVQLFYQLFFFWRVAFYKEPSKHHTQQHPVSVVICARDEDENIARNLPGVLVQDYKTTHEVIVVNDNSSDDSKYILAELQKTFKKLQIVELSQEAKHIAGKKFPLSIGIKEAKNEIVLLTDADCVPASEHWMYKMQHAFSDGIEIALGYGAYQKLPGFLNKLIRFETFHTALQYFSFTLAGIPYMGVGRNLAYRKNLFLKNKGFSSINHIPSGDDDLFINQVARKGNIAVVMDPDAFTFSKPKTSWQDWMQQKYRHYTTAKYYSPGQKILLGLYSVTHFFYYPLLIAAIVFFDWKWSLLLLALKLAVQAIVWRKAMARLNEEDLFPLMFFWDFWLFIYYFIFAPALWKKPAKNW